MAFKTWWECEECGHKIWSGYQPDESECICYVEPEEIVVDKMSREEEKARYKHQYKLNGYTWENKHPWMYMGAFENYKNRQEKGME